MTFEITERTRREIQKQKIEPQIVLEIEGYSTLFGAVKILRYIKVGDPGLVIGNSWKIGGLTAMENQQDIISFDQGTNTSIDQQLNPDKGSVSSVSSIQVALLDRKNIVSKLISPGVVIDEIVSKKATLWMGFQGTAFKDDYIPIFEGIIDEIDAGPADIKLNIAHPEQLKRQEIFEPVRGQLNGAINSSVTTIPLLNNADLLPMPVLGPNGEYDDSIRYYIQIEDEIIRYTGRTGNNLTGCTRGQLGTVAAAHDPGDDDPIPYSSVLQLQGSPVDLALKIMLSGQNGYWAENIPITRFNTPNLLSPVPDSVYFRGIDINRQYGVVEGDFATITGSGESGNNVTLARISEVVKVDGGSYIVLLNAGLVDEIGTSAVVKFRSQYDTLGDGLQMRPDQVDVNEHIYWNNAQLASYSMRFVLTEKINGKDFLDKQLYLPSGSYSLPRGGRCSMGFHAGPVVRGDLKTLNRESIKDPDKLRMRRGMGKNFYNTIITRFDKTLQGKYASGGVEFSAASRQRIKVKTKAMQINSDGMRRALGGVSMASAVANRYLNRYQFAAEYFENVGILFSDGFQLEPGDIFMFDPTGLKVVNTVDGTRQKPAKLYSVTNKKMNLRTGDIQLSITDTNFDDSEKYGSIAPSSEIVSGTTTSVIIKDSFGSIFPGNESRKWRDYVGLTVKIHNEDWTYNEEATLISIDPANKYKLNLSTLAVAPSAGFIVELGDYPDTTVAADAAVAKAVHAFLGASVPIVAGIDDFSFEVDPADIDKFPVGSVVRVHNEDFTIDSEEIEILSAVGDTVTLAESLGFIPDDTCIAEYMGFRDGGKTYRIF